MTPIRALLVVALLWLSASSSAQVLPQPGGGASSAQTAINTADIATNVTDIAAIGGTWTTPTFVAGEFTGSASMTWTVAAGDIATDQFVRIGNTVTYNLVVVTSTIGGTPDTILIRDLPSGMAVTVASSGNCEINDNTLRSSGTVFASGSTLSLVHSSGATYTAATDTASVNCSATFEVDP